MSEKKEKKRLVPKLRFPGFTDDWEQRKLGDITDRYDNLRIPVASNLRVPGSTPYYGANGIQDYVEGYTHEGEFILIAEDGASDVKNYPVICVRGRIWVNNHAHVVQAIEKKADNNFLKYNISCSNIESLLVGGGRSKLNAKTLMNLNLLIPKINEQRLIGKFLGSIDNLITLHQRKLEDLERLKKSLLQKMFPKNGKSVPELRFPGFTDDWEQRKLGDICSFGKGMGYSKKDLSVGGIPIILYGRLYTDYKFKYDKVDTFVELNNNGVLSTGKEVIIPSSGETSLEIARASAVTSQGILIGGDLNILYPNNEILPEFLALIITYRYNSKLAKLSQGKSVVHLYNEDMKKLFIRLPSVKEQIKISNFFELTDNLITLHQRKLSNLQTLKKSLLQQMFV